MTPPAPGLWRVRGRAQGPRAGTGGSETWGPPDRRVAGGERWCLAPAGAARILGPARTRSPPEATMNLRHRIAPGAAVALLLALGSTSLAAQGIALEPRLGLRPAELRHQPTIAQFLSPGYPENLVSARHAERIAWHAFESGRRNVYTAAAPAFKAVRLTNFPLDEGAELSDVQLSDDGSLVMFVHGSAPNREGWIANPTASPSGAERAIWAVRSIGGAPWRGAEGGNPALPPNGRRSLVGKDRPLYRARLTPP